MFAFLLLASQQICEIGLGISSQVIGLLQIPTSVTITIPDENTFSIGASWLLVIIVGFVIMWQFVKLFFEIAERYVVTALLVILSPLAFSMGGSKNTQDIFKGWCRMFGSMCVMMVLNVVFLKLLISAMGYMPSGVTVLPWMLLIVGIARVARKIDSIIARLGLNPAITGDGLGRGLPGMVAYAVVKGISSSIVKAAGSTGGKKPVSGGKPGGNSSGPRPAPHSPSSPPPPPPAGGSSGGGAAPTASAGQQKARQSDVQAAVQNGAFVSQQMGQGVDSGSAAVSEDSRTTGFVRQETIPSGQDGRTQRFPHAQETRRSSVPPEARAGKRSSQSQRTAAAFIKTTPPAGAPASGGPQAEAEHPSSTPQRPPIPRSQGQPGQAGRPVESGTPAKGHSRVSSVTTSQRSGPGTPQILHSSSHETVREKQSLQTDRTPKIPAPLGVGTVEKSDARPAGIAGTRPPTDSSHPHLGGDVASAEPAATRPPVGGGQRPDRDQPPSTGMAGTRETASINRSGSGGTPPSGMAGSAVAFGREPSPGSAVPLSGTAGTGRALDGGTPHVGKPAPSTGTAGRKHTPGAERPLVTGEVPMSGTAGTRRSGSPTQQPPGLNTPPSGTAGTAAPGGTKQSAVNRGTRRLKQGTTAPPMSGGQVNQPKSRRKRGNP